MSELAPSSFDSPHRRPMDVVGAQADTTPINEEMFATSLLANPNFQRAAMDDATAIDVPEYVPGPDAIGALDFDDTAAEAGASSDYIDTSSAEMANPQVVDQEQPQTNPEQLRIKYATFESAAEAPKYLSDGFIDNCISATGEGNLMPFQIGDTKYALKGYLDSVEMSENDKDIVDSPDAIADVHVATTEMLLRNLKILGAPGMSHERGSQISEAKAAYVAQLRQETPTAAEQLRDWATGDVPKPPTKQLEYHGFDIDGQDVFETNDESAADFRANFKMQRQPTGTFIMGYSDARVSEKLRGSVGEIDDQRIYLNPEIAQTPEIFEQLLVAANEAGIPIQLKMLARARELGGAHIDHREGRSRDALRGDGIVIYTPSSSANAVLEMALAIAQDHPDAFKGRHTSKIPQYVAEGISVGSEPVQANRYSLTEHRIQIFEFAAKKVAERGLQGEAARDAFRRIVRKSSELNGVNPDNIAFNTK